MHYKLSKYHVVTPRIVDQLDQQSKRLLFATRTAELHLIDDASWQTIESGDLESLAPELLSDLIAAELVVPYHEDELKTVLNRNNQAIRDDDVFSMVIQPTAFCQLGCGYCGQEHTSKWLSTEHQNDLLDHTRRQLSAKRFRNITVSWFGAEPLSGLSVIRSLTPRLKQLAAEFNCTYDSSMTTNGLALTSKVATELVNEHSLRFFTISLDGTREFHDQRRPTKSGAGTFDSIFANVVALASRNDLKVEIKIRANVDRRNCEGVIPLLRLMAGAGIQQRIQFYVAPIHSWGNDAHELALTPAEFAAQEVEWFAEMVRLKYRVGLLPTLQPIVCLAVQPYGTLVDATGTLFNCTEVSYVPAYGNPNLYAIGHVTRGETGKSRDLLGDFNSRVERGEYSCSSCRMLPVCGGACPKAWLEGQEPCPSAKSNIEDRLLLSYALTRIAEQDKAIKASAPSFAFASQGQVVETSTSQT